MDTNSETKREIVVKYINKFRKKNSTHYIPHLQSEEVNNVSHNTD